MNGPIRTGGRKTPKLASLFCCFFLVAVCCCFCFLFAVSFTVLFAFSQSSTDHQSKSETVGHIYMFVVL